ncbi:MAG: hypothetical protein M1820_003606 [Bogoriella megaspora]|nr:MAG: hypothetical protein M1820_003606 [Bogoriella megaspora]
MDDLFRRTKTFCNNCRKRTLGMWNRCFDCPNFILCPDCLQHAAQIHPGHSFRKVDLAMTLRELQFVQDLSLLAERTERMGLSKTPRNCCPTCFNHHPTEFGFARWDDARIDDSMDGWSSSNLIFSDIRASADRGCELCSVVYRGLLKANPGIADHAFLLWEIKRDYFRVADLAKNFLGEDEKWTYYFNANPAGPPTWGTLKPAVELGASFYAKECYDKIRYWLQACEQKHAHPNCSRSGKATLPRRVIAIGQGIPPKVHLHETEGEVDRYIAVSHCWGDCSSAKMTTDNLAQMQKQISFQNLPKTFRDAITVAQNLGIQYIWIDSLCIIQNSVQDWEVESAKMCDIYSDAYLVIVAASAASDNIGFLQDRPQLYKGVPIESNPGSGREDILLRRTIPHSATRESRSSIVNNRVDSRAWCMQEVMLARRSVYFHEAEMLWECHSSTDCECGDIAYGEGTRTPVADQEPIIASLGPWEYAFIHTMWEMQYPLKPFSKFRSEAFTYEAWKYYVVPSFTKRKLTRTSDRLPALSGIAALVARQCNDEYLAGIWRRDIKMCLLWTISKTPGPAPAYDKYLAPSFSWASLNRDVFYNMVLLRSYKTSPHMYGDVDIKVLEAQVTLSGANPFGAVSGGCLRVSGHAQELNLESGPEGYKITYRQNGCTRSEFLADTHLEEVRGLDEDGKPTISVNRSIQKTPAKPFAALVDGLLLADVPPFYYDASRTMRYELHQYALLILGQSALHPGKYQRLGIVYLDFGLETGPKWFAGTREVEFCIV